jgi:uncharacterized membrane protein
VPETGHTPQSSERGEERLFDTARTVALSDGVFAIALTLLVLTISTPELSAGHGGGLGDQLLDRDGEFLSYALSFAVIGLMWVRHHRFFRGVARVDGRLTALNLLYLGLVAFVPYPTRILGTYGDQAVAVGLYAATVAAVGLVAGLMRLHAERDDLLTDPGRRHVAGRESWLVVPGVFLLSIPIAFASPTAAMLSWLLLLVPAVRRRTAGPTT